MYRNSNLFEVLDDLKDESVIFLILNVTYSNIKQPLIVLYCPNESAPEVFENISKHI